MQLPARAVVWSTSYFPNVFIFLLTALGGLREHPGIMQLSSWSSFAAP